MDVVLNAMMTAGLQRCMNIKHMMNFPVKQLGILISVSRHAVTEP